MSLEKLQELSGDGRDNAVNADTLDALKAMLSDIRTEVESEVGARRNENEDTRYCRWSGQSPDGRKRKEALSEDPKPFDGASDNRVRIADQIINEQVIEIVAAATRVRPKVVGMEGQDEPAAAKQSTLLRYIVKQWRTEWRRQITLLANYMLGDTPAAAVAYVDWQNEKGLERVLLPAIDVQNLLLSDPRSIFVQMVERGELSQEMAFSEATDLLLNESRREELANALAVLFDEVNPKNFPRMAKELQEDGETNFPRPYDRVNRPYIEALRIHDDIWFPANTVDLQRAPCIFLRRWYSRAECIERAAIEGWSDEFLRNLIYGPHGDKDATGCEGQSAFGDSDWTNVTEDKYGSANRRKGQYEVIRCYQQSANDDGIKAWYVYTFSNFIGVAAKDRELWDRKHGKAPFIFFARESLRKRLLDSRGVSELAKTDQEGVKLLRDSFEDHVQTTMNPPIKKPRNRPFYSTSLAPFGQIDADPRDQIGFVERPPYPTAADKYWLEMRRSINEYWGRLDPETQPNEELATLHRQARVDCFLDPLGDCLVMALQLCHQYLTDEQVQRIVGGNGLPIARTVEEIQGNFDIELSYDVRDLSLEKVSEKARLVLDAIRPLDTRGVIPYEHFLRQVVAAVDPTWADAIPPNDVADKRVINEERDNFVKILNGLEPEMPERIDNPQLRLQTLQEAMEPRTSNPGAFAPMPPAALAMLNNRAEYLRFQAQQQDNAQIGRVGATPLAPEELGGEVVQ